MKKPAVLMCVLAISASLYAESAEAAVTVEPLGASLDLEWLEEAGDAEFAAELSASDFYTEEDGACVVRLSVYEREFFDMVAVSLLDAGDTILLDGEPVIIKALEYAEDGSLMINGGLDSNGGHVLKTDEDTVYYEEDADGAWNYLLAGEVILPLDENFVVKDYTDSSDPGAEYGWEDFFGDQPADLSGLYFDYKNTTVTVEGGLVTEIIREAAMEIDAENAAVGSGDVPYTVRISRNGLPIFEGPGYDYSYVSTICSAGTFTIVEEEQDFENNLWGKLQSGAGWVDLAEAISDESQVPITAVFGSDQIPECEEYVEYIADDSDDAMTTLAFRPNEDLENVSFCLLGIDEDGNWIQAEELYTIPELKTDSCFVAAICFYGDMTAYGISFTDEEGMERRFAVHLSGRNGSLLLDEYDTVI